MTNIAEQQDEVKIITADMISTFYETERMTEIYHHRFDELGKFWSATVKVDSKNFSDEYKNLFVKENKDTISFMDKTNSITYRTLTHTFSNDNIKLGLCFNSNGVIEVYKELTDNDDKTRVDYQKIMDTRISRHIIDPMFSFMKGDYLYVIYNNPSPEALDGTKSKRLPILDGNTAAASGHLGIMWFNLITKEAEKLIPTCSNMKEYLCGIYYSNDRKCPMIVLGNVFPQKEEKSTPTLKNLFRNILSQEQAVDKMVSFPYGFSVIEFINKTEITQVPIDGELDKGLIKIILENNKQEKEIRFIVTE